MRSPHESYKKTGSGAVTYDRAGFAGSDLPEMPYDIQAEVDALWGGLQRLAPNRALVLVGHSYGAFLSELFAAKHSVNVKGILLLDPNNLAFVDAIGGPDAVKRDPLTAPPYDRSRPELLTKDQRAELRVFDDIDNLVATMRSVAIPPGDSSTGPHSRTTMVAYARAQSGMACIA